MWLSSLPRKAAARYTSISCSRKSQGDFLGDNHIIRDNTVVKVYDKVSNSGNYDDTETIWYYVSVPVHDTPTDCKGWVKYKETSKYDAEKKKTLKSEIGIRIGAKYSEASILPNFKSDKSLLICDYDIWGRIEKREDGYVLLECSGGKMCWVNEKDLVYPEVP